MFGELTVDGQTTGDMSAEIMKAMEYLDKQQVLVGIPDGSGRDDELTNAKLLHYHTTGTKRKQKPEVEGNKNPTPAQQLLLESSGSPRQHIPPRPIIEPAIEAHQSEIDELLQAASDAASQGNIGGIDDALDKLGLFAQNVARDWFEDSRNKWPPLNKKTIDRKDSEAILIDTGAMRQAITYVRREE